MKSDYKIQLIDYLNARYNGESTFLFARGSTGLYSLFKSIFNSKGPGEVIIPSLCCESVAMVAHHSGLSPVFADVDPLTLCSSPESVLSKLSKQTRAILLVYLYGNIFDTGIYREIKKNNDVVIIEDIAHAIGGLKNNKTVGVDFDFTLMSFADDKIIPGDGGALICRTNEFNESLSWISDTLPASQDEVSLQLQSLSLRNLTHSLYDLFRVSGDINISPAFNFMMPYYMDLFVRAGNIKYPDSVIKGLDSLDSIRERRYMKYKYYKENINNDIMTVIDLPDDSMCWRTPVLMNSTRAMIYATKMLREYGIHASNHYFPLNKLFFDSELPFANSVGNRLLNLWVDNSITESILVKTVDLLNSFNEIR